MCVSIVGGGLLWLFEFVKFRNMSALGKPISLLRVHPCACIAFLIFFYLDDSFLSKEESISNQVVSQVIFDNGINQ